MRKTKNRQALEEKELTENEKRSIEEDRGWRGRREHGNIEDTPEDGIGRTYYIALRNRDGYDANWKSCPASVVSRRKKKQRSSKWRSANNLSVRTPVEPDFSLEIQRFLQMSREHAVMDGNHLHGIYSLAMP
jgi:hypothetical protein